MALSFKTRTLKDVGLYGYYRKQYILGLKVYASAASIDFSVVLKLTFVFIIV